MSTNSSNNSDPNKNNEKNHHDKLHQFYSSAIVSGNSASESQMLARSNLAAITRTWKTLTPCQMQKWQKAAEKINKKSPIASNFPH